MENRGLRKSNRIEATHLISYDLLDDEGNTVENSMARSLDLSCDGVLLEIRRKFVADIKMSVQVAVGEEIIDLLGIVRHSEQVDEDTFRTGVQFQNMTDEKAQKLAEYYPELFHN